MNIMGVRKADPGGQKSKVGGQKNKGGVKKTRAPNKNHTWEGRKVKPALVPKKFPWNKHTNNNQKDCLHRTGQGIGQSHATPVLTHTPRFEHPTAATTCQTPLLTSNG